MTRKTPIETNAVKIHKLRNVLGRLRNIRASSEVVAPRKSWLARLKKRLGLGKNLTDGETHQPSA